MPRVRNLGRLDFGFGLSVSGLGMEAENPNPVTQRGNRITMLCLRLRLDNLDTASADPEIGSYCPATKEWSSSQGETKLNAPFKLLLERLAQKYATVGLERISYSVMRTIKGPPYSIVVIALVFPQHAEPHLEIGYYSGYLNSLAGTMGKWWKELKIEKINLARRRNPE